MTYKFCTAFTLAVSTEISLQSLQSPVLSNGTLAIMVPFVEPSLISILPFFSASSVFLEYLSLTFEHPVFPKSTL